MHRKGSSRKGLRWLRCWNLWGLLRFEMLFGTVFNNAINANQCWLSCCPMQSKWILWSTLQYRQNLQTLEITKRQWRKYIFNKVVLFIDEALTPRCKENFVFFEIWAMPWPMVRPNSPRKQTLCNVGQGFIGREQLCWNYFLDLDRDFFTNRSTILFPSHILARFRFFSPLGLIKISKKKARWVFTNARLIMQ